MFERKSQQQALKPLAPPAVEGPILAALRRERESRIDKINALNCEIVHLDCQISVMERNKSLEQYIPEIANLETVRSILNALREADK